MGLLSLLRPAFVLLLIGIVAFGGIYSGLTTLLAQSLFPAKAEGSLIREDGIVRGSALIGQGFTGANYFWPRPSANAYDASKSGGSNLALTNPAYLQAVMQRANEYRNSAGNTQPVPVELLTASGSGLDPDISIQAALWQVPRVATARKLPQREVEALVRDHLTKRQFGVLGEPRVNVLRLNLASDRVASDRVTPDRVAPDRTTKRP